MDLPVFSVSHVDPLLLVSWLATVIAGFLAGRNRKVLTGCWEMVAKLTAELDRLEVLVDRLRAPKRRTSRTV